MKLLQPKVIVDKKQQQSPVKINLLPKKFTFLNLYSSDYYIKSIKAGVLLPKHILAVRKILRKNSRNYLKLWTRVFPNFQRSKKNKNSRMGKGKANLFSYVARVRKGIILFEITFNKTLFLSPIKRYKFIKKVISKLPIPVKIYWSNQEQNALSKFNFKSFR